MTHLRQLVRSSWFRLLVFGIVAAAWIWFLQGQLGQLRQHEWHIEPLWFVGGVFWGALYFAGLAVCWTLLLRTTGGAAASVALLSGASIWLSTMLARYVPGNIWHIVGRVALAGRLGVSKTQVAASATVEQFLTLLGTLCLFGLSLPFWRGERVELWLLLLIPIGLVMLHPRILGALLRWAATRIGRPELAWPYAYSAMLGILGAYVLANLGAGVSLYVIVAAIDSVEVAQAPFLVGSAALAWAVGYLSVLTPSGLGVREATLTLLLAQLFPMPVAIVASILHRLALTLGELVAYGVATLLTRFRPQLRL